MVGIKYYFSTKGSNFYYLPPRLRSGVADPIGLLVLHTDARGHAGLARVVSTSPFSNSNTSELLKISKIFRLLTSARLGDRTSTTRLLS